MSKILYTASSASHIFAFHMPYINALREEGHTVLTMAKGTGVDFDIPFEKKLLSRENGKCRKLITDIVEREGFDLIILNTSLAAFHIRLALKSRRRPRVLNIIHGLLFPERPEGLKSKLRAKMLLIAEKINRKKTDAILTMNEEDTRIVKANRLTDGEVSEILGMGIPAPVFYKSEEEIRRECGTEGKYTLLFVGELSKRKNSEYLISLMPKIKEIIPEAKLCLLGDGDLAEHFGELISSLGLEDSVSLIGRRENPKDYIRACDLYVSASTSEGLPFNIVEALSCGKPTVASDVKGHRDILKDGAGLLYPLSDSSELLELIEGVYRGNITVSPEKMKATYERYSLDSVFEKTYSAIKQAGKL